MDYSQPGGRGCFNCGDSSHQARDCPKRGTPTCYNCGEEGHVSRECNAPQKEKSCYRCGEVGHISRECPNPGTGGGGGATGGGMSGGYSGGGGGGGGDLDQSRHTPRSWLMSAVKVKNATSVARLVVSRAQFDYNDLARAKWLSTQTLPVIAPVRVADTVRVAMAEEVMAGDMEEAVGLAVRRATPVVVMVT